MNVPIKFDSRAAACGRAYPSSRTVARKTSIAAVANMLRALLAGGLALLLATWGQAGRAQDRASGDVQRVHTIGFTVADVEREANFFTQVLQFEKVSDFRLVGSEYGRMQGVFNANMRIVHL